MSKRRLAIATLVFLVVGGALLFVAISVIPFFFPGKANTSFERWSVAMGDEQIRVTAFPEINSFVPGAYYVFEQVGPGDKSLEIMTFRHDEQVSINRQGVRVMNKDVAYLFMGWMFASTHDGGRTWSRWDATKDLPNWICCNYDLIQDVEMNLEGVARMHLNLLNNQALYLYSSDYGRTWHSQQ